jgi:EAL domain-containing protein (putative c-di-GMP-specific phosphodiesterase class I)
LLVSAATSSPFAERIKRVISNPFEIDGHKIFTSSSIGIAISNHEYLTPEEILRDADIAMYNAKENHLGCAIFDRELRVRAVNSIRLETDLRQAIDRNELRVYYQPIVSLESGALSGFEALIRWQHPERGLISPAEFIPLAESNGQIVPMSNWILAQACGQLSRWRWRSAANRSLLISVNLSSRHFTQPDLIETVKHTLQETGLDPRCLKLELTESAVMDNAEQATSILQSLRSIGVQLSIDDFGTGYSSLSYLHKFPIDTLKIDRSFVSRMAGDSENSEIVRTIITLAQNLGLDTIAEGVETLEQLNELRSFGCRYAQGYLFAKPVPHEQIDELMRTQTNWLPEGVQPFQSDVPIQAKRGTGRLVTLPTSLKA